VIGGLYFGGFTATEGGAIGAAGAFLFALWRRALTWRSLMDCAIETARTTGALFTILIGALLFSQFMNFAGLPEALEEAVTAFGAQPLLVIGLILLLYVVLGTFFEELSMVLLTVPIFHPLVVSLGFDPIWFGIVIVMVVELGLISPPVGMNLFVVQSMLKTPLGVLWRWITPFALADVIRLAIVVAAPQLVLFLPGLMR
jgi:C4-dicarboxylate transporter DctM subunit